MVKRRGPPSREGGSQEREPNEFLDIFRVWCISLPIISAEEPKEIGQRIKHYRNEKGLSQEELANQIGTTAKHISKIENGAKALSLEFLIIFANALDTTANDLLGDNLTHSSPEADKELHEIFFDCNQDEKGILMKTLRFLKALLSEYGV